MTNKVYEIYLTKVSKKNYNKIKNAIKSINMNKRANFGVNKKIMYILKLFLVVNHKYVDDEFLITYYLLHVSQPIKIVKILNTM